MSVLDLSSHTILLVDDEVFARETVAQIIRSIGRTTLHQASDGAEAVEILQREHAIDLIICDFKMPEMNGLQLLQQVRTGGAGVPRNTLFAMLTGYSEKHLVDAALSLDVNAFLIKPVSKKVMVSRLQRMFAAADDKDWVKPVGSYAQVDPQIGPDVEDEDRQTVFDKVAEREFAAARVARALERRKGASDGKSPTSLGSGRFSALKGRFKDTDLAGDITDGMERLAEDMGRDEAIKVLDHLDDLQKSGVMSLSDIASTLSTKPASSPSPLSAASDKNRVKTVVKVREATSASVLDRDIVTREGDLLIQKGITLTPLIRTIISHLSQLNLLRLTEIEGEPAIHVTEPAASAADAPAARPRRGIERAIAASDLSVGDELSRNVYTADGRIYMTAGSTLSERWISLLKDLSDLGTIAGEIWVHS